MDTTKVSSTTFSASLSMGYTYSKGAHSVSVEASVGMEIQNSISNSLKKTTQTSVKKTCSKRDDKEVAMWQFQLSAEGALYSSENHICRYGSNASTPPSCQSFLKCGDAECTICKN
jgi:hypothetical protein